MKRVYDHGTQEGVSMFLGVEVEHTLARGLKTLFVVGLVDINVYEFSWQRNGTTPVATGFSEYAKAAGITHVYLGANQSFPQDPSVKDWADWTRMCQEFLALGAWVTLELDVKHSESLLDTGLTENRKFIPMISVKLPYVQQLGYNATIKLDDKGFSSSNPGVWCHQLHDLMQRDRFTDWTQYTKDTVIQ